MEHGELMVQQGRRRSVVTTGWRLMHVETPILSLPFLRLTDSFLICTVSILT